MQFKYAIRKIELKNAIYKMEFQRCNSEKKISKLQFDYAIKKCNLKSAIRNM